MAIFQGPKNIFQRLLSLGASFLFWEVQAKLSLSQALWHQAQASQVKLGRGEAAYLALPLGPSLSYGWTREEG